MSADRLTPWEKEAITAETLQRLVKEEPMRLVEILVDSADRLMKKYGVNWFEGVTLTEGTSVKRGFVAARGPEWDKLHGLVAS